MENQKRKKSHCLTSLGNQWIKKTEKEREVRMMIKETRKESEKEGGEEKTERSIEKIESRW